MWAIGSIQSTFTYEAVRKQGRHSVMGFLILVMFSNNALMIFKENDKDIN